MKTLKVRQKFEPQLDFLVSFNSYTHESNVYWTVHHCNS